MADSNEAYDILNKLLDFLQGNAKIRRAIAILLVVVMVGAAGYFIFTLLPRRYELSISGGDILSKRHALVKILQNEGQDDRVFLDIQPVGGSIENLKAVSQGRLDLAVIQGGLSRPFADVEHVTVLPAETIHILARPDIEEITALHGKTINMGVLGGGTRVAAREVLNFVELTNGIDYVETNFSDEALMNMDPAYLPDVVISITYIPSYLVEYLVREQGYHLLDFPNASAFASRNNWAAEGQILAGTYSAGPSEPESDLTAIGVELEVVANAKVPPEVIAAFLETLHQSSIETITKQPLPEKDDAAYASFPLSQGTVLYQNRKNPLITLETFEQVKTWAGSAMALLSSVIVVIKWFGGKKKQEEETGEA